MKGKLTKKSPLTEARLRAVNKRIDECNKELSYMDGLMEKLVAKVEKLGKETVDKVKKVQEDRLARE